MKTKDNEIIAFEVTPIYSDEVDLGLGEQSVNALSGGARIVDTVFFRNAEANVGVVKFKRYTRDETVLLLQDWDENYSGIGTFNAPVAGKYLFANGKIILLEELKETETPITKAEAITKYGEDAVFEYPNGDWKWKDQEENWHEVKGEIE